MMAVNVRQIVFSGITAYLPGLSVNTKITADLGGLIMTYGMINIIPVIRN